MKTALGGAAVAAVATVSHASAAEAADGNPVIIGSVNEGVLPTSVLNSTNGVYATFAATEAAVLGRSALPEGNGVGVWGQIGGTNGGYGVRATTSGHYSLVGVFGDTAHGNGEGIGVYGKAINGVGVLAECPGGYALWVKGRAQFTRSGKVTIAKGQRVKAVSPVVIAADTLVVATIQADVAGLAVQGVVLDVAHSKFTITLNKAAPAAIVVGWFAAN